jgi:hypothetical protein
MPGFNEQKYFIAELIVTVQRLTINGVEATREDRAYLLAAVYEREVGAVQVTCKGAGVIAVETVF